MSEQIAKHPEISKKFDDKFLSEERHWDKALVRHLFDVKMLVVSHPNLIVDSTKFGEFLAKVICKDALDFKNSHDDFKTDPSKELQKCIAFAKASQILRLQYEAFVKDMVYGTDIPSYSEATHHFESVLKSVLQSPALAASLQAAIKAATAQQGQVPSR